MKHTISLNYKKFFRSFLLLQMLFLTPFISFAQVTIGSDKKTNPGSLLDLKESENLGINANKGLQLPRVKLIEQNLLKPMFSYENESDTPTAADIESHIGLLVYNTNMCAPFGMGVYVWNGKEWLPFRQNQVLAPPSLVIGIDTLHIPSGMDKRVSSAQTLSFDWYGESPTISQPQPASTGSMSGGLSFTSPRGITPASGNWQTSPATLSVWADDMAQSIITTIDPWVTKQSKLTINLPENGCGPAAVKNLILNQTNYAIVVGDPSNPITAINLRDSEKRSLKVYSNTPWSVSAKADGLTWKVGDVLSAFTSDIKDNVTADGTTGTDYNFDYQGALASTKKYSTVMLTFSDVNNRAKDFLLNVRQCQGIPDMSDVYHAADANETTAGNSAWQGKVVYHPAKENVYREFYSAEFGNAGRWMITNLAATSYDGISHSASRSLSGARGNTDNSFAYAYWAYPSKTNLTSSTDFEDNPFLGYLYTWDAATAGKGGSNGKSNVDKYGNSTSGWVGDRSEQGMKEWIGSKDANNRGDTQLRRQGICPKGWHLPSDYEWIELEREIIANTVDYSDVATNIDVDGKELAKVVQPSTSQYADTSGPDVWRGSTHGRAMTDSCEPEFAGTSSSPKNNGFAILYAGYGLSGIPGDFASGGFYWTSSIAHGESAYARIFNKSNTNVHKYRPQRYHQFSVRCKKD